MEHRKENRTVRKLYVRLTAGSITAWGLLGDFSENGLLINSIRDFAVSTEINIEIFMPDNNNSFLKGILRRKIDLAHSYMKYGLGIELTKKDVRYTNFIISE